MSILIHGAACLDSVTLSPELNVNQWAIVYASGWYSTESGCSVPEPHLSEPIDLSLLSLWIQVIKAFRDLDDETPEVFSEIYQRK